MITGSPNASSLARHNLAIHPPNGHESCKFLESFHLSALMTDWRLLCFALLLIWRGTEGFAQEKRSPDAQSRDAQQEQRKGDPNCREWKNQVCTVCGIDSAVDISLKNKTKTPLLLCADMKPGPAKLVMRTHAEPAILGVWELEFGLGYQTSTRVECPHQFIASNNPPLKNGYEIGPITIESEIPLDGTIHALACVGLSSARIGPEGKETGASLRVFDLRVVSQ